MHRRDVLIQTPAAAAAAVLAAAAAATAPAPCAAAEAFGDAEARELRVLRQLGGGSYRSVYEVEYTDSLTATVRRAALSCEVLARNRDVRDAAGELEVFSVLQSAYGDSPVMQLLEQLDTWWVKRSRVSVGDTLIVPPQSGQRLPTSTRRAVSLCQLKPLYDFDLRAITKFPPYALGSVPSVRFGGTMLNTEEAAVRMALDLLLAGECLHNAGVLHRDVGLANCMVKDGRGVLIDFGLSEVLKPGQMCRDTLRGQTEYLLPSETARGRGCRGGDVYAMGRTFSETFLDYAPPELHRPRRAMRADDFGSAKRHAAR
ncbi:hypothetical protein JKP88DRAFT_305414 [Tribonema minus]|uniref:Protein kinase domain-containing protein n=1 Tax=Tribonema minus TaxID=303371 RepID=A0A835ZFR2_9STRA|nr:hypothetical protein JKP88DRAFT_305409 [Tribonema minus]KAG5188136.1 hypothetical protein JKP88DRAFT_305414 [Tribonema minus]